MEKKEWKNSTLEEIERLVFKSCDEEDLKDGRLGVRISSVKFKRYRDVNSAVYHLKKKFLFDDEEIEEIKREPKEKGYIVSFVNREYYGNVYLEMLYVKIEPNRKQKWIATDK